MFGFKGVHHAAISVPSLAEAKSFYIEKLGFELVDNDHFPPSKIGDELLAMKQADCHMFMVKAGNLIFEVFEFHSPTPKEQGQNRPLCDHGYTHLAFEVEDIRVAYDFLAKVGVTWHRKPLEAGPGYMMTYGRDPFGNVIEIQQLVDGLPYSFDQLSFNLSDN